MITKHTPAEIKFAPMKGLGAGFRAEWLTAEGDGVKAGLDSGAGFGNAMLTFWIERKGKREYFQADMRDLLRDLIGKHGGTS